jgi:hypothetical protein
VEESSDEENASFASIEPERVEADVEDVVRDKAFA